MWRYFYARSLRVFEVKRTLSFSILQTEIQKPNVRNCPRCELSNDINSAYCTRCGSPLDIVTAMKTPVHEGNMKEAIAEALKDPKVIEEVVHSYLLMQAKKGKK